MTAAASGPLAAVAAQIGGGRDTGPALAMRQATVASIGDNRTTVGITFAGSSTVILGVACLGWYSPVIGDIIWVAQNGADLLVLGTTRAGGSPGQVGYAETNNLSASTVSGAETVVPLYASAVLVAGRRYQPTGYGRVQAAGGPLTAAIALRSSGSAGNPTTASPLVSTTDLRIATDGGAGATTQIVMRPFVAAASGITILAMTIRRAAGTGEVTMTHGNSWAWLLLEDIGT